MKNWQLCGELNYAAELTAMDLEKLAEVAGQELESALKRRNTFEVVMAPSKSELGSVEKEIITEMKSLGKPPDALIK